MSHLKLLIHAGCRIITGIPRLAGLQHHPACTCQSHYVSQNRCRSTHHPITHRQPRIRRPTQLEGGIPKGLVGQSSECQGLIILLHINRQTYLRGRKIIGVSRLIRQEIDLPNLTHIVQESGSVADRPRQGRHTSCTEGQDHRQTGRRRSQHRHTAQTLDRGTGGQRRQGDDLAGLSNLQGSRGGSAVVRIVDGCHNGIKTRPNWQSRGTVVGKIHIQTRWHGDSTGCQSIGRIGLGKIV